MLFRHLLILTCTTQAAASREATVETKMRLDVAIEVNKDGRMAPVASEIIGELELYELLT